MEKTNKVLMIVNVKTSGKVTKYSLGTNGKSIGWVLDNVSGHTQGRYGSKGCINNESLEDTIEFVENGIVNMFDEYGIEVEFVNKCEEV